MTQTRLDWLKEQFPLVADDLDQVAADPEVEANSLSEEMDDDDGIAERIGLPRRTFELQSSFVWASTKQGQEFWKRVAYS